MSTQSVLSQKAIALKKQQRHRSLLLLSAPAVLALFMSPVALAGTIDLSWDHDADGGTTPLQVIPHVADGICPPTDLTSNIDFGTINEGDPLLTPITFTLNNGDTLSALNANIIESSGIPDGFVLAGSGTATSPFPAAVAASGSITFQVSLDPTDPGPFGGLVKINHDDVGAVSPFQFCVTGIVDAVIPTVIGLGDIQVEYSIDDGATFITPPILDDLGTGGLAQNIDFGTTDLNVPVSIVFKVSNTDPTVGNNFDLGTIALPSGFRFLTPVPASQTLYGDPTVVTDGPSEFLFTVEFEASSEGVTTGMLSVDNTEGDTAGDGDERPFNFFITGTVPVTTVGGADIQVWEETVSTVEVFDGVAPTTEFPTTFAGTPVSRNFVLTNIGDANLNLSSITLEQNGLPFTWAPVSTPFPDVLAPTETATLMVTFNAPDVGTYTGTLNIFNNAIATNENPFDIPLEATASSATKEIQLSEVATPDIQVGDTVNFTATPSAIGTAIAKTFTINNIGGTQLSIDSITFSSGGDGFTLGSFAATTLDASGGAADSATFDVTLNADTPGSFQGTVSIANDDDDENPFTFTVMGDIISSLTEPEVMVWEVLEDGSVSEITDEQTDIIDFSAAIGTATSKIFRVKNIGGVNLDLTALSPLPKGFSLVGVFPTEVQPSETVEFEVKLDTSVIGSYGGTLEFFSTDVDENPFSFPVGASVEVPSPEIDVMDGTTPIASGTTVAVEFGPTSVGSTVSKIFTVENTGEADLNLLSTVTFSEGGDGFTISSFNPGPIAAGAFTNFTVTLSASASGTYTGTLSFSSDDKDENPYIFPVSGTVDSTPPVTEEITFWDGRNKK
ncbi:Outer membrane autotransporter barrel [Beggiatoa sp. PS]|nr:Outer membrane autotransporter barrel [Beggiatoa sp. PS]